MSDCYRIPHRVAGPPLNFAALTIDAPSEYVLGPNDALEITVAGLYDREIHPVRVRVSADGEIHLPLAGRVRVGGMTLLQAQEKVNAAYADGLVTEPRANVILAEKSTTSVVVLGEVKEPGTYLLPKYENDVAHALAAAGGLDEGASNYIEVHRHAALEEIAASTGQHVDRSTAEETSTEAAQEGLTRVTAPNSIVRIPLHGQPFVDFSSQDVRLGSRDVVVVPNRKNEIFYVVGPLADTSFIRFSMRGEDRDLGNGFLLPRDRDIDVVTAVVMAGYIDPIQSPTTVTVHRTRPGRPPQLIEVDLIKARYNPRATIIVQPGDIIYLNPDAWWWCRRVIDQVVPETINEWIGLSLLRSINPRRD